MKIRLELESGKKIKLTEEEYWELMDYFDSPEGIVEPATWIYSPPYQTGDVISPGNVTISGTSKDFETYYLSEAQITGQSAPTFN